MDAERERKLEELFRLAAELSGAEREAFFARHCAADPELRVELESLLRQDDEGTKDFLKSPVLTAHRENETTAPEISSGGTLAAPDRIGRYRILERIGEGGMGAVYLAEQEQPVHRRVALKIVKLGMDSAGVVARFESERQALALMDHPGIARIFDGGTTDAGRPYFVMEYAPGQPIHEYCRRRELTTRARLELFCKVCEAVQHAHQKGVVHRDIKPANVLVAEIDGSPSAKVIDFGIAVAVSGDQPVAGLQSASGEVLGTFHYMAPEQADPEVGDVDSRADIYSLGILLYELLTGVLPHRIEQLRDKNWEEVQSILSQTRPLTPSDQTAVFDLRSAEERPRLDVDARTLARELQGDLDWITMKAMSRDRGERYPAATELAADVRRHLRHEPVLAAPPGLAYRTRKFVRRNRLAVLSAAGIAGALVTGTVLASWGMVEAQRQEADALASAETARRAQLEATTERDAADQARELAENEARLARAVTDFLVDNLAMADPRRSRQPDMSIRELLDRAAERVELAFVEMPRGEAIVRSTIGRAYHSVGELDQAEHHLRRALELWRAEPDPPTGELYGAMWELALVCGQSDSQEGTETAQVASLFATEYIAESNPELGWCLRDMWSVVSNVATREALELYAQSLVLLESELGPRDPLRLVAADVYQCTGTYLCYTMGDPEAVAMLEGALQLRIEQLGEQHPTTAETMLLLSTVYNQFERFEEGLGLARRAGQVIAATLPEGHWKGSVARSLEGESLSGLGRLEEAEPLLLQGHARLMEARGERSNAILLAARRLAMHFRRRGDEASAEPFRAQMADAMAFARNRPFQWSIQAVAFRAADAPLVAALGAFDSLVSIRELEDMPPESYDESVLAAYERVDQERRSHLAPDDPLNVAIARQFDEWGMDMPGARGAQTRMRMCVEAEPILRPHAEALPDQFAHVLVALCSHAQEDGDFARAEAYAREAQQFYARAYEYPSYSTLLCDVQLGASVAAQGRSQEAAEILTEAWQRSLSILGDTHFVTGFAARELVSLYGSWGRPAAAAPVLETHLRQRLATRSSTEALCLPAERAARRGDYPPELYELALEAARRALDNEPGSAVARRAAAFALARCGRHSEALELLAAAGRDAAEAAESGPPSAAVLAFRVLCLAALGRLGEADRALQELEERAAETELEPHELELVAEVRELVAHSGVRQ